MKLFRFLIIFCFCFFTFLGWANARQPLTDQAKSIYKRHHQAVFQIRVISRESGEKSALGSGFQFTQDGYIATNYHVVSDVVLFPRLFTVECMSYQGDTFSAMVVNIDPVHDLAVLKLEKPSPYVLELGTSGLDKGTKIFSLGNPYDLGMTIVEGLYNGIMERAMYRKILFSGSLNPGMSGGPALGQDGKVLGVNVSTAGNQISFFVPVEYLTILSNELEQKGQSPDNWYDIIRRRAMENQEAFLTKLISTDIWKTRMMGSIALPSEISDEFKCWAQSADNQDYWVKSAWLTCSTEDQIFISSTMQTGKFSFYYAWLEGRSFDPFRFYNQYRTYVIENVYTFDNAQERDAKNFSCDNDFIRIDGQIFYASMCARPYRDFEGLFDMNVKFSSVEMMTSGLLIDLVALGVTEPQAKKFLKRFIGEIRWQK